MTRPGGVLRLDLGPAASPAPVLEFQGTRALVYRRGERWTGLLGIPLDTSPGWLTAEVLSADGGQRSLPFTVRAHDYPVQHLKVKNRRHVDPNKKDLARFKREREEQQAVRGHWRQVALTDLELRLPVSGRRSSAFGLRRTFNGKPRSPHRGLDIAVPTGTPVGSPGDGVVALTGDYFFNGKTVYVDHGQGLLSMVCHLSRTDVRVGQRVKAGHRLGLAGSSGRATGPHVHWSVFLNGTPVDPEELVAAR